MPPQRIISLVPAATEWLCALGLKDRVVAVSHACDYPPSISHLPRVTRPRVNIEASSREIDDFVRECSEQRIPLYDLDEAQLATLKPDLIVTQTLCNVCAVRQSDVRRSIAGSEHCETFDFSGQTFDDVLEDAAKLMEVTGSQPESQRWFTEFQRRIDSVRQASESNTYRPRVTLLEWIDPLYCSGHWTPQLIQWAGGDDPLGEIGGRSRQITFDQLAKAEPEILLIACCGLDEQRNHQEMKTLTSTAGWQSLDCQIHGQVHLFDGSSFFNRSGPRLVDSLELVAGLIAQYRQQRNFSHR